MTMNPCIEGRKGAFLEGAARAIVWGALQQHVLVRSVGIYFALLSIISTARRGTYCAPKTDRKARATDKHTKTSIFRVQRIAKSN